MSVRLSHSREIELTLPVLQETDLTPLVPNTTCSLKVLKDPRGLFVLRTSVTDAGVAVLKKVFPNLGLFR